MNKEIEELLNSIDEIIKEAPDKAIYGIQIKEYKQIKNHIEQLKNRNKELYEGFMATQEELTDYATKNEQLENNRDKVINILCEVDSNIMKRNYAKVNQIINKAKNILKGDGNE